MAIVFFWIDKVYADCCGGYCCNGPSKTNPGNCAVAGCPACGADTNTQPWKKYECGMHWNGVCWQQWTGGVVCSLGDKCVSGEKGLRLLYML